MLRNSLFLLVLIVLSNVTQAGKQSPDDPNIQLEGRWTVENGIANVSWQGSYLVFRVKGPAYLAIDPGKASEWYRFVIDGVPQPLFKLEPGRQNLRVPVEDNLEHEIKLLKETFYSDSTKVYAVNSFNDLLPLAPQKSKRIAFFGDSNMEGTSLYSDEDSGHVGSYYAFPHILGRVFNAEVSVQARGSAALSDNGDNSVDQFVFSTNFLDQDLQYRDKHKPDLIVVNAGANDISGVIFGVEDTIREHYQSAYDALRQAYGEETHIVFHNAYGWDENEPANIIAAVIEELGGNVSYVLYPWVWEQWHGSLIEHYGQARLLAEHIESLDLGFKQSGEFEVFNRFTAAQLANPSFEHTGPSEFPSIGWRYMKQGVEHINGDASDGEWFVRLGEDVSIHQGNDVQLDHQPAPTTEETIYVLSFDARGNGELIAGADFEEQALYDRDNEVLQEFELSANWQRYKMEIAVPIGSWKSYISFANEGEGVVDLDNLSIKIITGE